MRIMRYIILLLVTSFCGISVSYAETLYVTDRILLGMHAEASEDSPLLDSVPSGTAVQVLETAGAFKRVRLPNGTTGWVSSGYLVAEKPASAQVDQLLAKQKKLEAELKSTKEKLKKSNREIQVRRDQLSNARTTIEELKKKKGTVVPEVDTKMAEELATANQEVENLKQKIAQLEAAQPAEIAVSKSQSQPDQDLAERIRNLEAENSALQGRIEMAQAHLTGKKVPLPEELALIDPPLPNWIWSVLVLMVIIGVIIGVGWMDYRHRQRHGGFRV